MKHHAYKAGLVALAGMLIGISAWSRSGLNRQRAALLPSCQPLENAPPALAFTTVALGGFRGIIANVLWVRAQQMQQDGRYFELIQLADWITKLQPRMPAVWRFHAWNLAYNVPVKFPDPADRWPWVRRGVELLRDDALRYNPQEIVLYQELGILYQHKMGGNSDDAQLFYKYELARAMEELMGGVKPDYAELLNPQTGEARNRVKKMREEYKLDPAVMKAVDEKYGPLEWRLPETHTIYWSVVGMKRSSQEDKLILRRAIYQSMQLAAQRGRMVIYPVDDTHNSLELAPNLDMIPNANRTYEEMMAQEGREVREHIATGHRNFLVRACFDLYLHNRMTAAEQWWHHLVERYPFEKDQFPTFDEYMVGRFTEEIGYDKPDQIVLSRDRAVSMVEGLLTQWCHYLVTGEEDMARGREQMAHRVHAVHMDKITSPQMVSIYERLKLMPYPQMKGLVVARVMQELSPTLQRRLVTALELEGVPVGSGPKSVEEKQAGLVTPGAFDSFKGSEEEKTQQKK